MGRHGPPAPPWRRQAAAVLAWRPSWRRPRVRLIALASASLVVAVVVALVVAPSPHVDVEQPIVASPSTARSEGTRGPRWPTVAIPTIGASGAWDPEPSSSPAARTTDRCSRCGDRPTPTPSTAPSTTAAPSSTVPDPPVVEPAPEPDPVDPQPGAGLGLVELVNRDRIANGCGPVSLHPSLVEQSQASAEDQAATGTMHHSAGVSGFDTWGENVAEGYETAAEVHDAWMASPGHRANILDCTFTVMGYGVADGASARYWTEQFAA